MSETANGNYVEEADRIRADIAALARRITVDKGNPGPTAVFAQLHLASGELLAIAAHALARSTNAQDLAQLRSEIGAAKAAATAAEAETSRVSAQVTEEKKELQLKIEQLEHKMAAYKDSLQDMVTRGSRALARDVPGMSVCWPNPHVG